MNISILEYLNELLKNTKISEFAIQRGGTKITIKRHPELKEITHTDNKDNKIEQKTAEKEEQASPPKEEEKRYIIKSPTVGVFYRGKTKIAPPLVKLNSYVKKGDQLGIIDCIGISENVNSPVSGKVVEILIDNHKPVEYNQPLFVIEKE